MYRKLPCKMWKAVANRLRKYPGMLWEVRVQLWGCTQEMGQTQQAYSTSWWFLFGIATFGIPIQSPTTENYPTATRNKEILPFVAILMDLEDIMLSEVSQKKEKLTGPAHFSVVYRKTRLNLRECKVLKWWYLPKLSLAYSIGRRVRKENKVEKKQQEVIREGARGFGQFHEAGSGGSIHLNHRVTNTENQEN